MIVRWFKITTYIGSESKIVTKAACLGHTRLECESKKIKCPACDYVLSMVGKVERFNHEEIEEGGRRR